MQSKLSYINKVRDKFIEFNNYSSVSAEPITGHRILLVDDHAVLRRGVRSLLASEPDFEICGEASSAKEALEFVEKTRPDVMVLDLQIPGDSGWWVLRELRKMGLNTRVVILSQYELPQAMYTARAAGCYGYVSKSRASEDLVKAIRAALAGRTFFNELSRAAGRPSY